MRHFLFVGAASVSRRCRSVLVLLPMFGLGRSSAVVSFTESFRSSCGPRDEEEPPKQRKRSGGAAVFFFFFFFSFERGKRFDRCSIVMFLVKKGKHIRKISF